MNDETNHTSKLSKSTILSIVFWSATLLFALCIFIFARVHTIRINGNQRYTIDQLLGGCGVTVQERLYGIDREEIEAQMLQKFPMLESVSVERGGFFSILIDVKERTPVYYTKTAQGDYLYLSDNFYVLEKSTVSPTQKGLSLLQLETPVITTATYGTQIEFDTSAYGGTLQGLAYNEKMIAFLNELRNAPFYASLTSASLLEPHQLSVYIDEIELYFGAQDNIAAKYTAISALLAENSAVLSTVRKINAADPNKATVFYQ